MAEDIISIYLGLIIQGILMGIGVAIGTYIANKHILTRIEKKIDELKAK